MTSKKVSPFKQIANRKGWTFNQIGERWGVSERQMSRVANSGNQRDLDAVNGIPSKLDKNMKYEQIVHDQALFCATEGLTLYRKLCLLSRKKDSSKRKKEGLNLQNRFSNHSTKCYMMSYMYDSAGRKDLQSLMLELSTLMANEATTAIADPDGWKEACEIAGSSFAVSVDVPEDELRKWRIDFLSAIKN